MSKDVKYLPLISKVETVDSLLRTTTHSAFPIVEDSTSANTKVPLLYRAKRLISEGEEEETSLELTLDSMYQRKVQPQQPSGKDGHAFLNAVNISPGDDSSNDQEGEKQLVLHGLILRTQLVTLLKNSVFIDENEQVDTCVGCVHDSHTCTWCITPKNKSLYF